MFDIDSKDVFDSDSIDVRQFDICLIINVIDVLIVVH